MIQNCSMFQGTHELKKGEILKDIQKILKWCLNVVQIVSRRLL